MNKKERNMVEALGMWSWRKMQRISSTERRTNEDNRRKKNTDRYSKEKKMAEDRTHIETQG